MANSNKKAVVIPIKLWPHNNSDHLSIVKIPESDYCCVVRTEDWANKYQYGVYLEPDSLVDVTKPQFTFLAKDGKYTKDSETGGFYARIKARRLRGVQSYGVLCPAPSGSNEGDDLWIEWAVERYNPPPAGTGGNGKIKFMTSGEIASAPVVNAPVYDVEGGMKYARKIFVPTEPLVISLKYNGQNGRWVYSNGEFHCGSHYQWKKEFATPNKPDLAKLVEKLGEEKGQEVYNTILAKNQNPNTARNLWWRVLRENEELAKFLQDNPDTTVYGEQIGINAKYLYGLKPGEISYRAFDIRKDGRWLDYQESRDLAPNLKWARTLDDNFPFDMDKLISLVENMPQYDNIGDGMFEEGIVVKTPIERQNDYIGRSQVKLINPVYLEKS